MQKLLEEGAVREPAHRAAAALRSGTSMCCHSAPSPVAQLAPTAEANEFKQLRFPVGSCNTNSSELLDPDFLWDSCSHLLHASCPGEDELQEMNSRRGSRGTATVLSCTHLGCSASSGGQQKCSECSWSSCRFQHMSRVPESSAVFPFRLFTCREGLTSSEGLQAALHHCVEILPLVRLAHGSLFFASLPRSPPQNTACLCSCFEESGKWSINLSVIFFSFFFNGSHLQTRQLQCTAWALEQALLLGCEMGTQARAAVTTIPFSAVPGAVPAWGRSSPKEQL